MKLKHTNCVTFWYNTVPDCGGEIMRTSRSADLWRRYSNQSVKFRSCQPPSLEACVSDWSCEGGRRDTRTSWRRAETESLVRVEEMVSCGAQGCQKHIVAQWWGIVPLQWSATTQKEQNKLKMKVLSVTSRKQKEKQETSAKALNRSWSTWHSIPIYHKLSSRHN